MYLETIDFINDYVQFHYTLANTRGVLFSHAVCQEIIHA